MGNQLTTTINSIWELFTPSEDSYLPTSTNLADVQLGVKNPLRCTSVHDIGVCENIGARDVMEDAITAVDGFGGRADQGFFAVYDGHGGVEENDGPGDECSRYAEQNLHLAVLDQLCDNGDVSASEQILTEAYSRIDKQMHEKGLGRGSGSTAVTCWVRAGQDGEMLLYIANVGDSVALLASHDGAHRTLTVEHKVSNKEKHKEEIERIRAAEGGPYLGRVHGILAVSRALGHGDDKECISGTPHTSCVRINRQDTPLLLLASDGVTDAFKETAAVDFLMEDFRKGSTAKAAAERLVAECLRRRGASKEEGGRSDNVAAIVLYL